MNTEDLTELQKMQVAYAHFTLEEWQLLANCVNTLAPTLDKEKVFAMLVKFPSAVL
jgi:hypothetical protein